MAHTNNLGYVLPPSHIFLRETAVYKLPLASYPSLVPRRFRNFAVM